MILIVTKYTSIPEEKKEFMASNRMLKGIEPKRPVMHTFFQKITKKHYTGMNDEDDRKLLETWKDAWNAAGWDTKILGVEDAMKFEDFEDVDRRVGNYVNGQYNKYCFHRWMAMAALDNGGFMSDYDTFPIPSSRAFANADSLPSNGRFTIYEVVPTGGGVPSLMSGNKSEWNRMLKEITRDFKHPRDPNYKGRTTDMYETMKLHTENPGYYYDTKKKVVSGKVALHPKLTWKDKCGRFKGAIAFHFSHSTIGEGIETGVLPPDTGASDRSRLAREWIKLWAQQCGVFDHVIT